MAEQRSRPSHHVVPKTGKMFLHIMKMQLFSVFLLIGSQYFLPDVPLFDTSDQKMKRFLCFSFQILL